MGKLGTLFYEVLLTDSTDKGIKSIESKLKQLKAKISVDTSNIAKDIEKAVSQKTYTAKVNLNVDTSALKNLTTTARVNVSVDKSALSNISSQISNNKPTVNVDTSGMQKAVDESKKASQKINNNFEKGLQNYFGNNRRTYTSKGTDISRIVDSWKPVGLGNLDKEYNKLQARVSAMKVQIDRETARNGGNASSISDKFLNRYNLRLERLQELSRRRDSAMMALERVGNMKSVMTVTDVPKKGSELWKRQEEERTARIASMKRAWNDYYKAQADAEKKAAQANAEKNRRIEQTKRNLQQIPQELGRVGEKANLLKGVLGSVFSLYGIKEFLGNLISIGGEFEKQKIALGALLGSVDRASTVYSQLKSLAVVSPFQFGQLAAYTKQMASFGIQYKDLYSTTKRLADVSAGVGVDLSRIILAYGQVFTAQFLKGTELKQFTEAGIPMVDALAKRFTKIKGEVVTAAQVYDMISKKQISFEDVKGVMEELTNEGGRFYNMQEKLSESLSGRWSNLKDQIEIMFSEISSSSGGLLKGSVSLLIEIAKQWKNISAGVYAALVTYGLLAGKSRILATLTTSSSMLTNAAMSNVTALKEEEAEYGRVITLAKEAHIAREQGGSGIRVWRNKGFRKAILTERARVGLAGGDYSKYDKSLRTYGIKRNEEGKIYTLASKNGFSKYINPANLFERRLIAINNQIDKAGEKMGGVRRAFLKAQLGVVSFGNSFKNALSNIFSMTNVVFMGIGLIIGIITKWWQDKEAFNNQVNDSIEGSRQNYKELKDFIDNNPIEIAISTKDNKAIDDLIKAYTEKLENAPIDLSWAKQMSNTIDNNIKKLEYLKKKIEELKGVNMKGEDGHNAEYAKDAYDESDYTKWYNLGIGGNLSRSLKNVYGEYKKMTEESERFYSTENIKRLAQGYKKFSNEQKNAYNLWTKGLLSNSQFGLAFNIHKYKSDFYEYRNAHERLKESVGETAEKLKEMYSQNPSKGVDFKNMTDAGFIEVQKTVDEMAKLNNWSEQHKNTFMDILTQYFTPAKDSTWKESAGVYRAFLAELDNYADEFKGKDRSDIMNGLKSGMKNGMTDALNAAKLSLITKFPEWKSEIQQILNDNKFSFIIAAHFAVDDVKDLGPISQVFDKLYGKNLVNTPFIRGLRIKEGENASDYENRLLQTEKDEKEKLESSKRFDKATGKKTADRTNYDNVHNVRIRLFGESDYDKKEKKKSDSASSARQRAKEKAQREREKKLRKYEKSLQNELKQIKRVRDLFYKLRDLYGDVEALERVRKSGLVKASFVPNDITTKREFDVAYGKQLGEFKQKINPKTETLKNLKNDEVPSDIFENQLGIDKDDLNKRTKDIERAISRITDAWSRYKSIKDSGVSSNVAANKAFGFQQSFDDLSEQIKSQIELFLSSQGENGNLVNNLDIEDILNADEEKLNEMFGNNHQITNGLWKWVDEYQKAAKALTEANDKMYSDLLKSSLSYSDKIANENKNYKEKVNFIQKRVDARPEAEKRVRNAQEAYDNAGTIKELEEERLHDTPEYKAYLKLLSELHSIPETDKINRDKKIKEINEAKEKYEKTKQYKRVDKADKDYSKTEKNLDSAKKNLYNNTLTEQEGNKLKVGVDLEHNKNLDEIKNEQFKSTIEYMDFFNAIYNLTIEKANTIGQSLKENLNDRLQQGTISAKDYYEEIQQIDAQMQKLYTRKQDSSLWFKGIKGRQDFRVQMADQRIAHAANSVDYYKKQENEAAKNGDEVKRAEYHKKATEWGEELKKAQESGDKEKEKQAKLGKTDAIMGNIGSVTESLGKFRDSVGGLMTSFGNDSENNAGFQTFSTVVDAVSEVGSGIQDGFQKIMSGDFIGAALSMISTPLNVIKMFNQLHDKKLEIMIKESQKRGKEIKAAADEIKTAIDDSLGTKDAKDKSLSRYSKLSSQLKNAGYDSKNNYYGYVYDVLNGKSSAIKDTKAMKESSVFNNKKYKKALKIGGMSYAGGVASNMIFGAPLLGGLGLSAFASAAIIGGIVHAVKKRKAANKELEQYYSDSDLDALPKKYKRKMKNKKRLIEAAQYREEEEQQALKGHGFTSGGNVSAYGAEYLALLEQRKEVEKQMMLENSKKDKDDDKSTDLREQLTALNEQIRQYAKNLAKELYGIDISGWANKLGESLVTAFENGENAAEAFHKTVNDIIKDIVKNMVVQDWIKPKLVALETTLFGKDGEGNGILSNINNPQEAINKALPIINKALNGMEKDIPALQAFLSALDNQLGGSLTSYSEGSSSMTISAKGLTEETGDLLASYVNAIRADVSINRGYMQTLVEISIPKMSVIAESQLKQLGQILEQTKLIENNTRSNAETAQEIKNTLSSVVVFNGGGKAIRIKQ